MDFRQYANAIASIESAGSGDYSALGPFTKKGNRAYGRYQVMDFNIGPWTEKHLGRRMTAEEFLANPEAQDKVFAGEFGSYVQKYGNPQDAASAWFTGRPLSEGGNRSDILGTTGNAYVDKFNRALGMSGSPMPDSPSLIAADTMQALGRGNSAQSNGGGIMEPATQQRQGLLGGLLGGFLGPEGRDARARLAIGLEGLMLNPNQALVGQLEKGIEGRANEKRQNATIEWLRSRRHDDLAAALEAGASPQDVLAESVRRMQPAAQPEPTALMQNVQWLMSQGIPMDRAIEMTRGGTTVNVGGEGQPTPQLLGTSGLVAIPDPSIPQGYRVEPAPGSPASADAEKARLEVEQAAKRAATGTERADIYKSEVVRAAEKAKAIMEKKGVTDILPEAGVFGSMLAGSPIPLPGSQEATDLKVTLEAVQSGVAFDRLQAMRDASATGGALGGIAVAELDLLMNSLGAIKQEASPALLRENLDNIIRIMTKIENDPVAGLAYNTGQVGSGTTGAQIPQNGPVRITNDAEYEALPSGTQFIGPDGKMRRKP